MPAPIVPAVEVVLRGGLGRQPLLHARLNALDTLLHHGKQQSYKQHKQVHLLLLKQKKQSNQWVPWDSNPGPTD